MNNIKNLTASIEKALGRSVILNKIPKVYGDNSFRAYLNGDKLIVEYAFENKLEEAEGELLAAINGGFTFNGDEYKKDISYLTYEEFGAVGDGVADDFAAIDRTHREANKYGQSVKANDEATYYMKDSSREVDGEVIITPIVIKTPVNWGKAHFVIDDRELEVIRSKATQSRHHIFSIESDYPVEEIVDKDILQAVLDSGLRPGVTKLPLKFDYPVMIIPSDSTHTVYRREGYGSSQGSRTHEVLVLDKNGNIDPDAPIMFDYYHLDKIFVYRLDIEHITIEGGIFTTRACRTNGLVEVDGRLVDQAAYIARGIDCRRSFTTIRGVEHYVTDEVNIAGQFKDGKIVHASAPYYGFFSAYNANEITYENCVLSGRRCYTRPYGTGTVGTYDLVGGNVNKLYFKKCNQHNFWITIDEETTDIHPAKNRDVKGAMTSLKWINYGEEHIKLHWGIGGVNFCKNLEYHDSILSRFDAHEGLYNGKIINCTVNYMALTGNGDMIVENTDWYSEGPDPDGAAIFHLRRDYGSTWNGRITAKNLNAYVYTKNSDGDAAKTYLFLHRYYNWFFGYIAAMPNLSLDNLKLYDTKTFEPLPEGYPIYMMQNSVYMEPQLHLEYTLNTPGKYCYVDLDGDGLVDGTRVKYDPSLAREMSSGVALPEDDPDYNKNLNVIAPPEYLRILNNGGNYKIIVPRTQGSAKAANDLTALPHDVDPDGGFFATTKFIYGDGDGEYYRGTNHNGAKTFEFEE